MLRTLRLNTESMTTYKYSLDRSSKKFRCPNCSKQTFVKYIENETECFLEDTIGRCDRETKCGYHHTPKGNKPLVDISKISKHIVKPSFHDSDVIRKFCNDYENNNFIKFLKSKFDRVDIEAAVRRYIFGTSSHWSGATIFWQIDELMRIRAGKIMLYNAVTGKRVKKPYPHVNWIHNVLKKKRSDNNCSHVLHQNSECNTFVLQINNNVIQQDSSFVLRQCLFGLHNLHDEPYKTIAIVESEKTAIMMSIYLPCYVWMATGSKSGFKEELLKPLKGRKILAYPDKSGYDDWNKKAEILNQKGYCIACSTFAEDKCLSDGDDLVDFMVPR